MCDKKKILIINGPNLNLVGKRNPAIYGTQSMEETMVAIQRRWPDVYFTYRQSNHEGDIIDWLQNANCDVIINAGGYTHTSVAIRDAVEYVREQGHQVIEVHISDIRKREEFRRTSLLTEVCSQSIIGEGIRGYEMAVGRIMNYEL